MSSEVREWLSKTARDDIFYIAYNQAYDFAIKNAEKIKNEPSDQFFRKMITICNEEGKSKKVKHPKTFDKAYQQALRKIEFELLKHFLNKEEDADDDV